MHNTGQASGTADADIDAPEAWDISTDASNVIIAVLDTGVDYDHSDLAANMWTNYAELNGTTGVDDDGNGYVDDIYGWDFADNDNNPDDYNGHGTHCSGTIGAIGDNDQGVAGVCWSAQIMPLKIFPNYDETAFIAGAIDAIEYAVDMGAKVLSNSWGGGPYSQSLKNAIDDAENAGVLFIAAAGNYPQSIPADNDAGPHYPSSYDADNIIAVMSTDHDDNMSYFLHYGATSVDIAAPGSDVYSCLPDDEYGYGSGTSMATPHVAGACALLWSKYPYLTYQEVKTAILDTADVLDSLDGLCVTGGRLNLYRALSEAFPLSIEIDDGIDPNSCGIDPTDPNNNTITYTITFTHEGTAPCVPSDPNDPNSPCDPNITGDIENVTLVDYLPTNINTLNVSVSDSGAYNPLTGEVTWYLGTLSPGDSNSVTVTITVLEGVEPFGTVDNVAELSCPDGSVIVDISTPVCCYGGDIIYVDSKAQGRNVGLSWHDAYTELSSALNRAAKGCGTEIWVAGGIYTPTNSGSPSVSFELADGVEVYGGFTGNETSRSQRNFIRNKTYLSGDISATDNDPNSDYVVSAGDGVTDSTILDGFVICRGVKAGVHLYDQSVMDELYDPNTPDPNCVISPNIVNCYITNNEGDGIHGQLADPNIYACIIANNDANGIALADVLYVSIDRSVIRDNTGPGISLDSADSADITNCFIYNNSTGVISCNGNTGINLRNNTIVYNEYYGINLLDSESVTVTNSILWGNNDGDSQYDGCTLGYCCYETGSPSGTGNINTDPGFAVTEPNACNYHLATDSNCIDAGVSSGILTGEKDIDGDARIYDSYVDIGADEVSCDDVVSAVDHNGDGVVSLIEFSLLSAAWLTEEPNYDPRCDYYEDGTIDISDLGEFAAEWLWEACWRIAARGSWLETSSTGSSRLTIEGVPSIPMSMAAGGESMMMSMPMSTPMTAESVTQQLPLEDQVIQLQDMLDFLEMIYKDDLVFRDSIDKKTWKEFIDNITNWIDSLAEDYLNSIE